MAQGFTGGKFVRSPVSNFGTGGMLTNLTAAARTGTALTNGGSTHTKAASYTTLIASTGARAYGIWVHLHTTSVANNNQAYTVDIAIGAAASETIIIPDIGVEGATAVPGRNWYFPGLDIAQGERISARSQGDVASATLRVDVFLETEVQWNVTPGVWTAYGFNSGTTRGTSQPTGNGAFGAWTQIGTASTDHKLFEVWCGMGGPVNQELYELGKGPNIGAVTTIGTFLYHRVDDSGVATPPIQSGTIANGDGIWVRGSGNGTTHDAIVYAR